MFAEARDAADLFAEAAETARSHGEHRQEGCGFVSFAEDLTAHRQNLNACGNDLAGIRARLARVAEAEGWNFNEQEGIS